MGYALLQDWTLCCCTVLLCCVCRWFHVKLLYVRFNKFVDNIRVADRKNQRSRPVTMA